MTRTWSWGELFERARSVETTEAAVRETLARRRERGLDRLAADVDVATDADSEGDDSERGDDPPESVLPTRIVADADVLAADLLLGGSSRETVDVARAHSWLDLAASDPLLSDARATIDAVAGDADPDLADDWLARVASARVAVDHPAGDPPGLASAYRGGAAHLLTLNEQLTTARAGLSVQPHAALSVRRPEAFGAVFDAAALYAAAVGGDYPGADRDPRD